MKSILRLFLNLFDEFNHLEASLNYFVRFIHGKTSVSLLLLDSSIIAHDNVLVSECVHLVDFVLITKLIKSAEQPRQELHDLSWIFHILAEVVDANHISVQDSQVIELVNVFSLRHDDVKHM